MSAKMVNAITQVVLGCEVFLMAVLISKSKGGKLVKWLMGWITFDMASAIIMNAYKNNIMNWFIKKGWITFDDYKSSILKEEA